MAFPIALIPTLLSAGVTVGQIINALRSGDNPFGSKGSIEQFEQDTPEVAKFKKEMLPRMQNILRGRMDELEQPYQSPYERLSQSPLAPLLMGMAPGMYQDLSGDPEAGAGEWLAPMVGAGVQQGLPQLAQWLQSFGQQEQPMQQTQQPRLTPEQVQEVVARAQARDQQAAQFNPYAQVPQGQYDDYDRQDDMMQRRQDAMNDRYDSYDNDRLNAFDRR